MVTETKPTLQMRLQRHFLSMQYDTLARIGKAALAQYREPNEANDTALAELLFAGACQKVAIEGLMQRLAATETVRCV